MIRAIVTGSRGQVATALAQRAAGRDDLDLTFLARPEFDLQTPEPVAREILERRPDAILSVAAYTAVDLAEDEPDLAMAINGHAPGVLARAAAELGIPIVHLSTDYVFSGTGSTAYAESDLPAPVTQYGRSKLAGEQAIAAATPQHVILRTAWVYGAAGKNFAKTMLALAENRDELSVVHDQVGNPTCALDIADGLVRVLTALTAGAEHGGLYGTYHMAGAEEASWYEFAQEIFRQSTARGGPTASVVPVDSSAFPTKAKRPANSRLNCAKFSQTFGLALPGYTQALPDVVEALLDKE